MTSKKNVKNTINEIDNLPLVMTPADIAKVLQISRNTVYEMVHRADFPVFRIGKQYRVHRSKFIQWMDEATAA